MHQLIRGVLGGTLALGAALSLAAAPPVRISLPGRGDVLVTVPDAWSQSRETSGKLKAPTLELAQKSGPTFHVSVSVLPAGREGATSVDPAAVRAFVDFAAKEARSQSVEKTLPIHELPGVKGQGYYFRATDRAPAPGEWKYLTQGAIGVGNVLVVFTVLTNDGQDAIASAALDMLRTAAYEPPSTST